MKITLCDKKIIGDVPSYEVTKEKDLWDLIHHWLETKDFDKSVFVCFETFIGEYFEDIQEIKSIFVSSNRSDLSYYISELYLPDDFMIVNGYLNNEVTRFSIFEFETYKDAFNYCLELKEGY